jgi:hypothetical protein
VRYGLIEAAQAETEYGVILAANGDADMAATARRRASR